MQAYLIQDIFWGDGSNGRAYLYGSVIDYKKDGIEFENLRFPSGKPIHVWYSRTNYQERRQSPSLPLLRPGSHYVIQQDFTVEPAGGAYLQLTYFNRQGEEIGLSILRESEQEFTYPKEAFTYTLTLVSAGCERVRFSRIRLYAKEISKIVFLSPEPRGYYGNGRYPVDIQFVETLLKNNKTKE